MARASKNAEISSKNARIPLTIQAEPYWYSLGPGQHLGYRKTGEKRGNWIARYYSKEHGRRFATLGLADDSPASMGSNELTYSQALDKAREAIKAFKRDDTAEVKRDDFYTVALAMGDYMRDRERVRRKPLPRTRSVINTHILPTLGNIQLEKLTHGKLKSWRDDLAEAMPRVRNKPKATEQAYRQVDLSHEETARKRQATANRIFTVLRAALNFAEKDGRVSSNAAWKRIRPFGEVDAPKVRYLTVEESRNLIAVCPEDFQALVRAALYTGCRYGELMSMRVDAYSTDSNTIHIPKSKSGRKRHIPITDEGAAFFASITANRPNEAPMFFHADGIRKDTAWEESQQRYWIELACEKANITPVIGFHILRHTYGSQLAMTGTPMAVIASLLGHADTRMTEKHYGHLSPSYVANTLRANLPSFGYEAPGPVLVSRAG